MTRWRDLDHVERETELREIRARWDAAVEDHPTPDAEESFADNGLSDMGTLFDEIERLRRERATDALLPRIREHIAAAVQAERERLASGLDDMQAAYPDEPEVQRGLAIAQIIAEKMWEADHG